MTPIGVDEWVARSGERRDTMPGWQGAVARAAARVGWWPRLAAAGLLGARALALARRRTGGEPAG